MRLHQTVRASNQNRWMGHSSQTSHYGQPSMHRIRYRMSILQRCHQMVRA
jgi:hypothetical protein